ncbi:hypothetical protein [Nocardia jinanensis]|uniref:Uncharacterized protein n=1 Tax=Nocardia jinanensis TaxID=382504 RepID=A0A917VXT0_9NOCA|nr:hypothetical protein [Nocardia jinanensis]GGL31664.1 hypothetical protein GCM10011588_52950 [Nocardia jinanensis]
MPSRSKAASAGRVAPPIATPAEPADRPAARAAPAATLNLPYLSAEVAIPGPGINVKAGPVEFALPTRYLYYGGLGVLTVAGAVELPVAGALAAAGLIVDRLRRPSGDEPANTGAASQ